jgi:hypothetical protein
MENESIENMISERSLNDVLADSAATRNEQQDLPFIPHLEKHALTQIIRTKKPDILMKLGESRWNICLKKWESWDCGNDDNDDKGNDDKGNGSGSGSGSGTGSEPLGLAVQEVIDKLDAPHLRPSLINQQLEEGNTAASFSFLTLMSNLSEP